MNYEKKYKQLHTLIGDLYPFMSKYCKEKVEGFFPELKESEDERIRKWLISQLKIKSDGTDSDLNIMIGKAIAWLEKQGGFKSNKWTEGDVVRHGGILALVTNGRKAMKSNCEQITIQYPDEWVKAETKERKYFFEELEKQGESNPYSGVSFEYNGHTWGMCARDNGVEIGIDSELKAFVSLDKSFVYPVHHQPIIAPKSAMDVINEEKVDNANKVEPKDYNGIDPHFGKPIDKVEPKFKVKYAGSEYNVLEVKDSAGTTFYGIEDEPNHIDYVRAENCEMISGYGINDNGSPYPTKPAVFSEQKSAIEMKSAEESLCISTEEYNKIVDECLYGDYSEQISTWSEEDEMIALSIEQVMNCAALLNIVPEKIDKIRTWLRTLKDRVGCEVNCATTWKPSDEQIEALEHFVRSVGESGYASPYDNNTKLLYSLLGQLKKLREE